MQLRFRDDGCFRTAGNGGVLGEKSCVASHHLDEDDAFMALCRVTDPVDTLHDGVHRRVIADGVVRPIEVVVDGAGQADAADVKFLCEFHGASQRSVPADDHQCVNACGSKVVMCLLPAFFRSELLGACRLQNRSALADDSADILGCKRTYIVCNQSVIPTIDGLYVKSVVDTRSCHGTDGRIHTRCITAGSQNTDCLYFSHFII